jgi:hypothetical protein
MLTLDLHPTDRMLRQFAAAWLIVLSGFAANQWLTRGNPRLAAALAGLAFVVGIAGLLRPRVIRWLFVGTTVVAFPIGWVVSQVMLFALFIGVITPVALLFKLRGRDRLARKRPDAQTSYWKPKSTTEDMRRYLRQY